MQNSIGERVILIRKQFGINQGQLSEEIGMDQSIVSKVERNKHDPSTRFLNALMLRFAVNPEWIKTGKGGMFISPEDYIAKGIELLGPKTMCEGFLTILKDHRFAEFQVYLSMDKFRQEQNDNELQELLQLVSRVWHQGDKRNRKFLEQMVRAFPQVGEGENK